MPVPISQFLSGGEMLLGDQVAGLRTVNGVENDYRFNFPGTGVKDSVGNYMFRWLPGIGVNTNYVEVTSAPSTFGPTLQAAGGDPNVNLNIGAQGTGVVNFTGTSNIVIPSGTAVQALPSVAGGIRANTTSQYLDYWSTVSNSWVDLTTGSALSNLTFVTNTDETAFAPNSQPLSLLATGFATVTTTTGIVGSRVLTGTANEITISNGDGTTANPTFSIPTTFIAPGTIAAVTSVSAPAYLLTGSGSGTISILPQAAAGTYNFNLPITAGTSGYLLTSAGGAGSPMTWSNPASIAVTSISGTANEITASASTGAVTLSIPSTFIAPGSIQATTSSAAASFLVNGSTDGVITIKGQAHAGTYEFDLPTTAGTSGYFLTSAGGAGAPMTWTANTGATAIQTIDGDSGSMSGTTVTINGGTTGLTTTAATATMSLTGTLKANNGGTSVANSAGSLVALGLSDSGSANAYAVSISPAPAAYAVGQTISFIAANANTTASTLAINALGTKAITKHGNTALASGDIAANQVCTVVYDGTQFQLENPVASAGTGTVTSVTLATGLTAALAITGTNPITTSGTITLTSHGNLIGVQTFTSGSAQTYTPTTGTATAWIRMWGGGGAGGGAAGTTGQSAAAGGGQAGSYVEHLLSSVSGTYTYTVGAGGTPGSAGNNVGGNGAATTFSGGTLSAGGGGGGGGSAAQSAASVVTTGTNGAGGTATGGNITNAAGSTGGYGVCYLNSGCTSGNGGNTSLSGAIIGSTPPTNQSNVGFSAIANTGCGGSGGAAFGAASAVAGGSGGSGLIIIFEYS